MRNILGEEYFRARSRESGTDNDSLAIIGVRFHPCFGYLLFEFIYTR